MKTAIICLVLFGLFTQACQTKTTWASLPQKVQIGFLKNVHNPKNVSWNQNEDYYFASFIENGEKGLAVFNKADNQWIETEVAIAQKDLTNEQLKTLEQYKNFKAKYLKMISANHNTKVVHDYLQK